MVMGIVASILAVGGPSGWAIGWAPLGIAAPFVLSGALILAAFGRASRRGPLLAVPMAVSVAWLLGTISGGPALVLAFGTWIVGPLVLPEDEGAS